MIVEVVFNGSLHGEDVKNVLHYEVATWDVVSAGEFTGVVSAEFTTNCSGRFEGNYKIESMTFREVSEGSVGIELPVLGGPIQGSGNSGHGVNQLAVVGTKLCNTTTKPTKGRIFMGGVGLDGINSDGLWDSETVDKVQDFLNAIVVVTPVVSGVTWSMVVLASDPSQPNTQAYNLVDQIICRKNPASLSRRRQGRGS
jgi:hypothetical protein